MQWRYHRVDVFTDRAFCGNPLAVFPRAEGLDARVMQKIAREFNLSETTFVLPPEDADNACRLRIFTPGAELPMAGHPTIGTAFVLARTGQIDVAGESTTVVFEEGVGPIPVTLHRRDGALGRIDMQQPLPRFGPEFPNRAAMAELLSIPPQGIDPHLPLEVVSCGVPMLFVPIRDLVTMRAVRPRLDLWDDRLRGFVTSEVFVFTPEVEHAAATVHSRMFAPSLGVAEDPATGAASGPLGCYLVKHRLVSREGALEMLSEQGIEIGRPSFVHIRIEQDDDANITRVLVGGTCVHLGEGFLEV